MEYSGTKGCERRQDFITVTVGNTVYTVEHVYGGDKTIQEVMSDFLEREARNLDT